MNVADDINALADLGWGPDKIDQLARIGFEPGQFATFRSYDRPTRQLILRMLDRPTEEDHAELRGHPRGREIAEWLLTLPAYANAPGDDEDDRS